MTKSISTITNEQIVMFLSETDLFSNLSLDVIQEISEGFELIYLAGNSRLIKQSDIPDCLYVLMFGFLRALKKNEDGSDVIIGELSAGSVVGEIGCLFDEPRTASVYTIRDSVLLKMTRAAFDSLLVKYPNIMMGIVRQSVKRLVNPEKYSPQRDVSCFCLIPAGNYSEIERFSQLFVDSLSKYGETLLLTYETISQLHGGNLRKASLESAGILSLFQELETKYKYLVYVVTDKDAWANRCIRQTDKILLVGKYGDDPALSAVESYLQDSMNEMSPVQELVLLFESHVKNPTKISAWTNQRQLSNHYKVRLPYVADLERVVRLVTGNALGLILSGGGACALSHVGVIRALQEANIPIDYIGGSSMGGLVGGLFAREVDYQTMTEMLTKELTKFQRRLDYTLPITALIRGKLLDKLLSSAVGSKTRIENLWQKYFCVSTNISTNELHVYEQGLLWKAIRASLSLPGILPAVFDEKKQVFVDGGILNNLPVDVMLDKINNGKILASSLKSRKEPPSTLSYEEYTSSGWHLLFKYFLLPKLRKNHLDKKTNFITIASIIQNSMLIGSDNHQQSMIKRADYDITMDLSNFSVISFAPIQEIIDSGYRQALLSLESLDINNQKN
jgi:NTE family protein